jgi:hypothetical protein
MSWISCLSVMDHNDPYIFVRVSLGKNDQEVLTSSPLYLQEGDYFSADEFLAADGGFYMVDFVALIRIQDTMK